MVSQYPLEKMRLVILHLVFSDDTLIFVQMLIKLAI